MSNAKNKLLQLVIVVAAACLSSAATDVYTPSLPAIAQAFGVNINLVQLTLVSYMAGLATSQLVYGPLSEGLGRRTPLLAGLIIMFVGSVFCLFSSNIHELILARFVQGCGAGACAALWRSIFRDLFQGEALSKYGSYAGTFITLIMPAIPALGGYLQHYIGWQANFIFIAAWTTVTALMVLQFFEETNQHHQREHLKLSFIYKTFKKLLSNESFLTYSACALVTFGGVFAWVVISPALLMKQIGISPVNYGWILLAASATVILFGNLFNSKFISSIGMQRMLTLAWVIMLISGALTVAGYFIFGVNVYAIVLPSITFLFGATLVWPNTFASAFKDVGKMAGYAGALYGCMQIAGGVLMGAIAAHLPHATQIPIGFMFMASACIAWILLKLRKPHQS